MNHSAFQKFLRAVDNATSAETYALLLEGNPRGTIRLYRVVRLISLVHGAGADYSPICEVGGVSLVPDAAMIVVCMAFQGPERVANKDIFCRHYVVLAMGANRHLTNAQFRAYARQELGVTKR